jgi:hypothetical protein
MVLDPSTSQVNACRALHCLRLSSPEPLRILAMTSNTWGIDGAARILGDLFAMLLP